MIMSNLHYFYALFDNRPEILDNIVSLSYIPPESIDLQHTEPFNVGTVTIYRVMNFTTPIQNENFLSIPDKYSGFPAVTESKLLMYPFSYIEATAYTGNQMEIHMESINGDSINFESWGHLSPDSRVAYLLKNYNGSEKDLDNALIIDNFPEMPTARDVYANYLSTSKASRTLQTVGGLAAIGIGVATANPIVAGGGVATIGNMMAQQRDMMKSPNTLGLQAGGNGFNIANDVRGLTVKKKIIKPEYREKIEKFWKTYGYKVNLMKIPNLKTRQYFNFVKTVDVNIKGPIPQDDLQRIKDLFNDGLTIWHDPEKVQNYNVVNSER